MQLSKKIVTNFSPVTNLHESCMEESDGCECEYIFEVKKSCNNDLCYVSSSDMHVYTIDCGTLSISSKIRAHDAKITCIQPWQTENTVFMSSSEDQFIKIWDTRSGQSPRFSINTKNEVNSIAIGMNDHLLAASWENSIYFYDARSISSSGHTRILGQYADVHTDIVTQLDFSPQDQKLLVSSSEDGLVTIYNTATSAQEAAVVSILNTECPVRKFGFFGSGYEGLFVLSTVETASFWHYPSNQRIVNFPSIRDDFMVDYLIDCSYDTSTDELLIIAGRHDGNGCVLKANPEGLSKKFDLNEGHSTTLRCWSAVGSYWFTGGEDASVCAWTSIGSDIVDSQSEKSHSRNKHKEHSSKKIRFKPY